MSPLNCQARFVSFALETFGFLDPCVEARDLLRFLAEQAPHDDKRVKSAFIK